MSDTQLTAEKLNEERAFIKRYTEGLSGHSVEYPADFSTPLDRRPRKVAVVGVDIADPPDVMDVDPTPTQDTLTLTVKSLKPALTFTLTAQTTDTIAHVKSLITAATPAAPAPETQRLLLKGKALVDTKLVKEYNITDGAVLTLMLKAPTAPAPPPASPGIGAVASSSAGSTGGPRPAAPSLTITTETDGVAAAALPVTDADIDVPPQGPQPQVSSAAFHMTIADPQFWQRIHALCVGEFALEDDADAAWETFLVSMKGRLSAGEAAKIRDVVGVKGMGGGA